MKQRNLVIALITVIFSILIIVPIIAGLNINGKTRSPLPDNWVPPTQSPPTPTPDPHTSISILLLGYGGGTHEGSLLTDTMLLVQAFPKEKKMRIISLPRDLWLILPVSHEATGASKLNAAYAVGSDDKKYPDKPNQFTGSDGGGRLAKYAVETIVGFPINYYASFSFKGFVKSVDVLGGIDINVTRQLTDKYYPLDAKEEDTCGKTEDDIKLMTATASGFELEKLFPCRFETLDIPAGIQHMDGITALKYVRSRHSDLYGGDFNRSGRQREFLKAMTDKIFALNFIPKAIPFITSLTRDIKTDLPLTDIPKLTQILTGVENYQITDISLSTDNVLAESKSPDGQYILIPKSGMFAWDEIRNYLNEKKAETDSSAR